MIPSNKQFQSQSSQQRLDKAIIQMKSLLGEDMDDEEIENLEKQQKNQEQSDENLDSYVTVLDQKYSKILQILEEEERNLKNSQLENQKLKKDLGDMITNARKYTVKKNQELQYLQQINNQKKDKINLKERQSHYDMVEKQKVDEIIAQKEAEISQKMQNILNLKEQNFEVQDPIASYKEQINVSQNILADEMQRLIEVNQNYEESEIIYQQLKKEYSILNQRNRQLKQQSSTFYGQTVNNNTEKSRLQTQHSLTLQKHSKALKLYEKTQRIKQALEDEINDKSIQMDQIREFNQNFDKYGYNLDQMERQTIYESSRNIKLQAENEVLKKELEKYLYIQNRTGLQQSLENEYCNSENINILSNQNDYYQDDDQIDVQANSPPKQTPKDRSMMASNQISPKTERSFISETRKQFNTNPNNQQYVSPEVQTEIQRLLDLHQSQSPQEIEQLQQKLIHDNQLLTIESKELEEKVSGRMNILESQYEAIQKLEAELQETDCQVEDIEFQKNEVISNYEQLEQYMDVLNNKFVGLEKSISNPNLNTSVSQQGEKLPYYQLHPELMSVEERQNGSFVVNQQIQQNESFNILNGQRAYDLSEQIKNSIDDENIDQLLNVKPQILKVNQYQ